MSDGLTDLLADMFDAEPDSLTDGTAFEDLGADEYDFEEISFNLEELYGFKPTLAKLKKLKTLRDLREYIGENTK